MVKINYLKDDPYILAALGVKISQAPFEKTLDELYQECKENKEESKKLVNSIIKIHHHNILLDFTSCAVTIEGISRFAILYLWRNINAPNLVPGAGIEASFRVTKPKKYKKIGPKKIQIQTTLNGSQIIIKSKKYNKFIEDFGRRAFNLYEMSLKEGIPVQDAKYMLPEGALTRVIFAISPRYLLKLYNILKNSPLEELREISRGFEKVVREIGFETETGEIPATSWEIWDEEIANNEDKFSLNYSGKSTTLSLNYDTKGSLSMYADLVRERQILCELEPSENIAKNARFVVPNSFSSKIKEEYLRLAKDINEKQLELIEKKDPNFVYFLLLGQEAKSKVSGSGKGILETSKKRCCGVVLGELRSNFAVPITRELAKYDELKNEIGPRCWRENRCLEPATFKTKKNKCPVFEKYLGKKPEDFDKILDLLYEPCQVVVV